jgi:cytochrome c553
MKTKNLIFSVLVLIFFVITVVSFTGINYKISDNEISDNKIVLNDTTISGQGLFRMNCAGCHGLNREGKPPTFPSLVNIQQKLSKEQVRAQIKSGKGLMPPHTNLSDKEISAITAYLFNEPEQQVAIREFTPTELGRNLVTSNCISCHRLSVNDPLPPNAKTMCRMMVPAPFAGVTKRFTKDEFYSILQTGPCYMPSFDFLTASDKDAVWAYLKTLEGKGEPEGKTMGQMCPKMKRMKRM